MIDYTGKLNTHNEYLEILNILKRKTNYIEIVLIDEKKTNDLVEKFKSDIISQKIVSSWWGTETVAKNKLIKIQVTDNLFEYLSNFETFCKYYSNYIRGDYCETTDFGIDDIAFYNKNDNCLLCTTTHEGYISVSKNLFK